MLFAGDDPAYGALTQTKTAAEPLTDYLFFAMRCRIQSPLDFDALLRRPFLGLCGLLATLGWAVGGRGVFDLFFANNGAQVEAHLARFDNFALLDQGAEYPHAVELFSCVSDGRV